jgi:dTDP-4-dehydrorhamnose 3,5-epimerase-like enzyme
MHCSLEGMLNLKNHVTDIMDGNNETMLSVSQGYNKGIVVQKDESPFEVTLHDVLYIPKRMVNLFSLT